MSQLVTPINYSGANKTSPMVIIVGIRGGGLVMLIQLWVGTAHGDVCGSMLDYPKYCIQELPVLQGLAVWGPNTIE